MGKRLLALLLMLVLLPQTALGGVAVRLTAGESDVLSAGALRALSQWLEQAQLFVNAKENAQEVALRYGEEDLLAAVLLNGEGALCMGGAAVPLTVSQQSLEDLPAQLLGMAAQMGETLAAYEKKANATAELGGVVKAKTQLTYALSAQQWAEMWPQICAVLGVAEDAFAVESKATVRRYFAADGSEIGAYFYAEKVRVAPDDVREVRLEYGCQENQGLYLAFRCPNKNETRNVRISLTAKRSERTDRVNYTVNGDIRIKADKNQDTLLLEASLKEADGRLSGKTTVNYTQKRSDQSTKYALDLKPDVMLAPLGGTVAYAFDAAGQRVLAGDMHLAQAAEKEIVLPAVYTDDAHLTKQLTRALYNTLLEMEAEDRLELIYYLNRPAYLVGEETDIELGYDPEFTVTEVPE